MPSRPGVRGISPAPGASVLQIGSRCRTAGSGPPILMQYPRSRPQPQAPAVGPNTQVMDPLGAKSWGGGVSTTEIGVAAADENVAPLEGSQEAGDGLAHAGRGPHHPARAGLLSLRTRSARDWAPT